MSRKPPPKTADVIAEVRAIYRELEGRNIERNCTLQTECCRFILSGSTPYLTKAEAVLAATAWRAAGKGPLQKPTPDGACPMLDRRTARCMIYADRPFGCRTHFCKAAGGPYARREVSDLI